MADARARLLRLVASHPAVDRMGDSVVAEGIDLTEFRKNPILLLQHDPAKPIGVVERLTIESRDGAPALVGEAERAGFRQMIAVIGDGSPESPSVRLHLRAGFRHCGQLQGSGFKHGRWLDTVFMQLAMNGGSSTPPDDASLRERRFFRDGGTS